MPWSQRIYLVASELANANVFEFPVRVYYEDTDSGGLVYYANYLKFLERARTEMLRSLGIEQDRLIAEESIIFAVRSANIDYLRPARFNELLVATAQVKKLGKASVLFLQEVRKAHAPSLVCVRAEVKIACLDAVRMTPTPLPLLMLECLKL